MIHDSQQGPFKLSLNISEGKVFSICFYFKKLFKILHNYALGVVGIDVAGDEGHLEEGMDALFDQVDFLISNDLKLKY